MSNYDGFRDRTSIESASISSSTIDFISKSKSSRTITHSRITEDKTAVLTNQYKEGADEWILFTALEDTADNNIKIGDFIVADNVNYLVYEEYNHPQKELYLKHRVIECNVEIKVDSIVQYAMYLSSLRSYTKKLSSSVGELRLMNSGEKPIVITADNVNLKQGMRFMLGTQDVFEILNLDRLSNPGIVYMSVRESSINSYYDDLEEGAAITAPEPIVTPAPVLSIQAGVATIINTNFAYGVFSSDVKILSKTVNTIEIECPFGVTELTVTTKDGAGDLVETIYEVV